MSPQTTDGQWGTPRLHARFVSTPSVRAALSPPVPPSGALAETQKPKLLDQVRHVLWFRHYSYQTEKTYVHWIKRFILFHHKRHPREMGKAEVEQFLTVLAVDRHVSAATLQE